MLILSVSWSLSARAAVGGPGALALQARRWRRVVGVGGGACAAAGALRCTGWLRLSFVRLRSCAVWFAFCVPSCLLYRRSCASPVAPSLLVRLRLCAYRSRVVGVVLAGPVVGLVWSDADLVFSVGVAGSERRRVVSG